MWPHGRSGRRRRDHELRVAVTVASGAGATSYTPVEADGGGTLTLSVTYTDGEGNVETVSASSAIAEIAGQATLTLSAPVEEGTAVSVSSLTGDPEGDGAITNYVWQVDGTTVASGAGATSYTPVEADGGKHADAVGDVHRWRGQC